MDEKICDHVKVEKVDDDIDRCTVCKEDICKHNEIDYESTCTYCGVYIQEISNERPYSKTAYTYGNQTSKTQDHTKLLKSLGFDNDIIRGAMIKYSKVDNRVKNEIPIVAICTFLTLLEADKPKTIHEIAAMFKQTRAKLAAALKSVYKEFPEFRTKYITITSMIKPLMVRLGIDCDMYYKHIHNIAKFVEKRWNSCDGSKRSTPQNIASVIIYKYISISPTLRRDMKFAEEYDDIRKSLNISVITLNNIEKTLVRLVDYS